MLKSLTPSWYFLGWRVGWDIWRRSWLVTRAGKERTPAMRAGTRNTFCVRILLSATSLSQGCFKTSKFDLPQKLWQRQLAVLWTSIWERTGYYANTWPDIDFYYHRHLTPHHFNKELFLEFNLGPQVDWVWLLISVIAHSIGIYTLITFVFSIFSRAWLMKLLKPWRGTSYTRGTSRENWWRQWTVLQIQILGQPSNLFEKVMSLDQSCQMCSGAELRYHLLQTVSTSYTLL